MNEGARRRWAMGDGGPGAALRRVRFRGGHYPAEGRPGDAAVTIVPQEACHYTEMTLPLRPSLSLGRVVRLNLPAQLPGEPCDGVAWERMAEHDGKGLYGVWAWRGHDDGPALPEARLIGPALARHGWAYLVQPRGERVNLYLRPRDGGYRAYTFVRDHFADRLRQALRAAGIAPGDGAQVVEPGERPIESPALAAVATHHRATPLAAELWLGLPLRRRFALAPELAPALAGRFTGPLLVALTLTLGWWVGGVADDWREARRVEALGAELELWRGRSAELRDALDSMERGRREWAELRRELERRPPLADLLAAVAPHLGEGGRIHDVVFSPTTVTLSGIAREATAVLNAVEAVEGLREARFNDDLSRDPARGLEHFRIEARWPHPESRRDGREVAR